MGFEQLAYPNKSHRKSVTLPKYSKKLAEFFGLMIGDGGINNRWQANVTMNSDADAPYAKYVSGLITELFGIEPAIRKRKDRRALVVSVSSTTLVDFLVDHGLVRGNKLKAGLAIPDWILRKKTYKRNCVRGLIDTDGCLYIHKHIVAGKKYRNIGLCFTSHSSALIGQVAEIFEEFGIIPHITKDGRHIYLYSEEAVKRYMVVFGTSNDRIQSVYTTWRRG